VVVSVLGQSLAGTAPLSDGVDYVRVVLSLLLCLALGVGMAFLARRMKHLRGHASSGRLAVVESIRLDAKTSVHAVRYGSRHVLVTTHAGAVAISPIESPEAQDATPGDDA
jgi:flagellar protein FliO/FliZ